MSGCEGVAPSMWHILAIGWLWMSGDVRELRHLCGICWLGWLMDVGRYEGVTPSMWAFPAWFWRMGGSCAIYVPKGSLMLRKKYGENSAEDCQKWVIFMDTWRNWPVLNGSWAIYPPHFAFDIDGATQDSERLLWHQSRTFLYCIKKWIFSSSPKGTPHDRCRRTMKKTSCNENQWNWVVFPKNWWIFSLGTYILCM